MGHSRGKCVKGRRVCLKGAQRGSGQERGRGCVLSSGVSTSTAAPERVGGGGGGLRLRWRLRGGRVEAGGASETPAMRMLQTRLEAETCPWTVALSARGRHSLTGAGRSGFGDLKLTGASNR